MTKDDKTHLARANSSRNCCATRRARSRAAISWASPASAWPRRCWAAPCPASAAPAYAAGELGDRVNLTTWPNYHAQDNLDAVHREHRRQRQRQRCSARTRRCWPSCRRAAPAGTCSCRPTTRSRPIKDLEPRSSRSTWRSCPTTTRHAGGSASSARASIDGMVYAVPKDWGTTGFVVNTDKVDGADARELEGILGPDPGRALGPGDGARLPADHHRQCAEVFRLFLQLDRPERAGRGREAADRRQAASVRASTPTTSPSMRTGDAWMSRVLDRRRHAAAAATCRRSTMCSARKAARSGPTSTPSRRARRTSRPPMR